MKKIKIIAFLAIFSLGIFSEISGEIHFLDSENIASAGATVEEGGKKIEIPDAKKGCPPNSSDCIELLAPFPGQDETGRFEIKKDATAVDIMGKYVSQVFLFGMGVVSIFSVLILIVGGFEYMSAGGESSKTDAAKQRITQALLGLVLVFLSALLLNFINPSFFRLT
ncbi:hypothetical protein HZA38_00425 [Candidatus Peregrinibacteria bacterium]|nr:hypothetical protein [Candidatus Peregrinibacteria bacterium]